MATTARIGFVALLPILLVFANSAYGADEDLTTQLMRSTVKISHEKSTATGFILSCDNAGRHVLVTAAHVFLKTPDDQTTVIFRVKQDDGQYKKEPVKLAIRKNGKPIWTQHATADVAVIAIDPPADADLAAIPIDVLADDAALDKSHVRAGVELACLGYPHRVEGNAAGFPLLRNGPVASYPLLPTATTKKFFVSINTFEGDSGGPVFLSRPGAAGADKEDARLIVGLVSAQEFLDEEIKSIYEMRKVRTRLGLATIVPASFIKETVEMLKQ